MGFKVTTTVWLALVIFYLFSFGQFCFLGTSSARTAMYSSILYPLSGTVAFVLVKFYMLSVAKLVLC